MKKRNSAIARIVAALALIAAVAAIVVVINGATGDSSSETGEAPTKTTTKKQQEQKQKTTAKTYTVEAGDNFTVISEKTGVPISDLRELNPDVDPQILEIGEKLKLR
ncbi:MAG: LysM domain-containing protein [Solirubrobacterales bacterium]